MLQQQPGIVGEMGEILADGRGDLQQLAGLSQHRRLSF